MNRPLLSHALAGLAGAMLVVLLGLASGPQAAPPPAPQPPPPGGDEVVRLLRSIDQKLDSRLVENPATVGQAVHRVGFIVEQISREMRDLAGSTRGLASDTRRIADDVGTIKHRMRN